jgi:hypothetical protein
MRSATSASGQHFVASFAPMTMYFYLQENGRLNADEPHDADCVHLLQVRLAATTVTFFLDQRS